MNIVITGSIAYDYLMSFPGKFTDMLLADQLHNISVSFLVDSLKRQRGGTAPNIAYTLALLGSNPTVMATAGQDFGDYRVWLEKYGVEYEKEEAKVTPVYKKAKTMILLTTGPIY